MLALDRDERRLDARILNSGGGHDLHRISAADDLQFRGFHLLPPPRPTAYVGCGIIAQGTMMDLPPGLSLTVEDRPSAEDWDRLGNALDRYNRQFLGETGFSRMGFFVRAEKGEVMAGLVGTTYAGWLFVAELWVHADLRRRGIGSKLLALAEQRAAALGCHSAMLDTFSFQGPEFYPRFGYEVYGTLDYPPEHKRLFLKKRLTPETR